MATLHVISAGESKKLVPLGNEPSGTLVRGVMSVAVSAKQDAALDYLQLRSFLALPLAAGKLQRQRVFSNCLKEKPTEAVSIHQIHVRGGGLVR